MTEAEGEAVLGGADPDELSGLVMSSAHTLRAATNNPNRPIAVIGFSMGASLAFWLSARLGSAINAVVAFYGAQSIDFDDAAAAYLGHFATDDHIVSDDDKVVTESFIRLGGRTTEFHTYPGTKHWFFEEGDKLRCGCGRPGLVTHGGLSCEVGRSRRCRQPNDRRLVRRVP